MKQNLTKKKLMEGEPTFGCFLRYTNADLAEFLALQGFDFLIFDAEHGPVEPPECASMVRALELHGVSPLVRVPCDQPVTIPRFLDIGIQGLMQPMVNSVELANEVIRRTKYAPLGCRGLAGVRAADYGMGQTMAQYTRYANDQTLVIVQVETPAGIEALPEVLALSSVDVAMIGPMDLSQSLGVPGETNHAKVREAVDRIIKIVHESGKTLGVNANTVDSTKSWLDRGARFLVITAEAMIKTGCRSYLDALNP